VTQIKRHVTLAAQVTDTKENALSDSARELTDVLSKALGPGYNALCLVLAVDEVQALDNHVILDASPFAFLRRAVRELRNFPIFTLAMSTNGSIRKMAPPAALADSARVEAGRFRLLPPFVAVGFDQLAEPVDPSWTLTDFCKLSYIATLGRPL
jgi:hypothetical protein